MTAFPRFVYVGKSTSPDRIAVHAQRMATLRRWPLPALASAVDRAAQAFQLIFRHDGRAPGQGLEVVDQLDGLQAQGLKLRLRHLPGRVRQVDGAVRHVAQLHPLPDLAAAPAAHEAPELVRVAKAACDFRLHAVPVRPPRLLGRFLFGEEGH